MKAENLTHSPSSFRKEEKAEISGEKIIFGWKKILNEGGEQQREEWPVVCVGFIAVSIALSVEG